MHRHFGKAFIHKSDLHMASWPHKEKWAALPESQKARLSKQWTLEDKLSGDASRAAVRAVQPPPPVTAVAAPPPPSAQQQQQKQTWPIMGAWARFPGFSIGARQQQQLPPPPPLPQ